jgi:hypothetical protein
MGCFLSYLFSSPSRYDITNIKIGFSKEQIESIYGRPGKIIYNSENSTEEWIYTIPFRVFVSIKFDTDGKVSRIYRSGEPPEK